MSQKNFWKQEYEKVTPDLTGSRHPSHAVNFLLEYVNNKKLPLRGRVLDLGFGRGRNAIFLAKRRLAVYGIDFTPATLKITKSKIKHKKYAKNIHLAVGDFTKKLTYPSNFFDFVLDILASNTVTDNERGRLVREVGRVLKPGGIFVLYAPKRKGEKLIKTHPGPEPGTFIHPQSGLVEKSYSLVDLKSLYQDLSLVTTKYMTYIGQVYGKAIRLSYICAIFRKPPVG